MTAVEAAEVALEERFNPDTLSEDEREKGREYKFRIRVARAISIVSLAFVFLGLLQVFPNHLNKIVGTSLLVMYIVYFGMVFYLFISGVRDGRHLFRVVSVSAVPDRWASMNMCAYQVQHKYEAIQSISEFSAIDGGVAGHMLSTVSAYTWCILVMQLAAFSAWTCGFSLDIADVLELVGIAGLLFIGLFELDRANKKMKTMHYVGAGMGTCTIAGYMIQQWFIGEKIWLPFLIAAIAIIGFALWQISNRQTDRFQENLKSGQSLSVQAQQELSMFTLKNVAFEAVFLFCGALCTSLWLWDYGRFCDYGCHARQTDRCDGCNSYWKDHCM
eukprot:CAMPEP_0197058496 /NCGR_PEP_ID=MMETSP1384-20130603/108581_1 /TAXON_ID=29189 /ORGANISM="Ammonia sp." /LENGTH=329 /DNA_ID=CAMNT_0042493273 /DNA_START=33 /DNA_END=1022 /DNA_ORIENTATION=+